jgi:RHS repeat-associated protein
MSHLLEDSDGQGDARVDYIYLDDRPVATYQPFNGKLYYLHTDRLGTPQLATDDAQGVVWTANYDPFGSTSTGVGVIVQNLRLPGQEFEAETGWNHNGFRDYVPTLGRYLESDPIGLTPAFGPEAKLYAYRARFYSASAGRFISEDPTGLATGLNFYRYASNNPISFGDPLGLFARCIYSQSSGQLTCEDTNTGQVIQGPGYSGNGIGRNNGALEGARFVGPIPLGLWNIESIQDRVQTGASSIQLVPAPGNDVWNTSRDPLSFFIHGENRHRPPFSSSEGCPVVGPDLRLFIGNAFLNGGGGQVLVIP